MAGVKGRSGGDRRSLKAKGIELPALPADKDEIGELIRTLEANPLPDEAEKNLRAAGWRRFWDSKDLDVALKTRMFLYDHWRGKARHTVNHLHDKPIDLNVNVSMAEIVREVRHRKQEYERSRK